MATTKIIPGVLDLNSATSDKGLKMPAGTASNRPTGVTGSMRFDSDITAMEYYNGTDWKEMGTGATGIETTSLSIINTDVIRRNQVAPTDDDYYTLSFWIKPDFPNYSSGGYVFEAGVYSSVPREMFFSRTPSSTPGFWLNYDGGATGQDYWSGPFQAPTSDFWQHYCLTKQGGNAPTFYINGVATPTWVSSVAPSLPSGDPGPGTRFNGGTSFNPQTTFNSGQGGARGIAGEIAHVQFVDGAIVTPTNFVQTVGDFTYPKAYTGSFGNNGFQLLFENASNYQEETSGNSHTFTTFTYQSAQTSSIYY